MAPGMAHRICVQMAMAPPPCPPPSQILVSTPPISPRNTVSNKRRVSTHFEIVLTRQRTPKLHSLGTHLVQPQEHHHHHHDWSQDQPEECGCSVGSDQHGALGAGNGETTEGLRTHLCPYTLHVKSPVGLPGPYSGSCTPAPGDARSQAWAGTLTSATDPSHAHMEPQTKPHG